MTEDVAICLACGSSRCRPWTTARDVEYQTTPDSFGYFLCEDCEALFIHPVPRDRLNTIYPSTYYTGGKGDGLFSVLVRLKFLLDQRFFRRMLKDIAGSDLAALDVGGGGGGLLTAVRASDPRVNKTVVVDLGDNGRQAAEKAGHIFHRGLFETFETEDRFDVIFLMNLIEHVGDPLAVLTKARDLMRPGGKIIVQTPNWRCLQERLFRRHSWTGYHCPRHWVLWHKPGFEALARRAGLSVLQSDHVQAASFWASSVGARLREWGLLGRDDGRPLHAYPAVGLLAALFALIDIPLSKISATGQMLLVLGPNDQASPQGPDTLPPS